MKNYLLIDTFMFLSTLLALALGTLGTLLAISAVFAAYA